MRHLLALIAISVAALTSSTRAHAAEVLFTITGPNSASFSVEQAPTPDAICFGDACFEVNNVPGVLNGSADDLFLTFYPASGDGGANIQSSGFFSFNLYGEQLFTGTIFDPTFILGTFALSDVAGGQPVYTLTIEAADAAVPEPATWAMMLLGFGAVGFAMRRRRHGEVTVRSAV